MFELFIQLDSESFAIYYAIVCIILYIFYVVAKTLILDVKNEEYDLKDLHYYEIVVLRHYGNLKAILSLTISNLINKEYLSVENIEGEQRYIQNIDKIDNMSIFEKKFTEKIHFKKVSLCLVTYIGRVPRVQLHKTTA